MQKSKLSQEQKTEWIESPVTLALLAYVKKQIAGFPASKANCFTPFQAERTQELLASLNGAQDTWEDVLEILEGDWTYFVEEEGDEQVRD